MYESRKKDMVWAPGRGRTNLGDIERNCGNQNPAKGGE